MKSYDQPRQHIKKQRHYFANKSPSSQTLVFSVVLCGCGLDHKESWVPKNWCFWTVVLKKTLEKPLDCKIKPVNPKGNQSWIFTGRTDAEAEASILWPPEAKSWLIWKALMLGKTEGRRRSGWQKKMMGWHHWLNGHESEQSLGVGWWTGMPGVLQSMGLQRIRDDWASELNRT